MIWDSVAPHALPSVSTSLPSCIRAPVAAGCGFGKSLRAAVKRAASLESTAPAPAAVGNFSCSWASSGIQTSEHTNQAAFACSRATEPLLSSRGAVILTRCTACPA